MFRPSPRVDRTAGLQHCGGAVGALVPKTSGLPIPRVPNAHLGQQSVAHELQLVRGDVHGHVERRAQQLPALILELHEQPLHVARRRLVLCGQAR